MLPKSTNIWPKLGSWRNFSTTPEHAGFARGILSFRDMWRASFPHLSGNAVLLTTTGLFTAAGIATQAILSQPPALLEAVVFLHLACRVPFLDWPHRVQPAGSVD